MKHKFLALAMLPMAAFAQNSGQSSESASLRIELAGTTPNYEAIIKITNKQTCAATVKVDHNGQTRNKLIAGLGYDTVHITLPECTIKAKPLDNCGNQADMGWVEMDVCQALPVKFEWIRSTVIDRHTVKIEFKLDEVGNSELYAQVSADGRTFKRVQLVTKEMQVGQVYTTIIKL